MHDACKRNVDCGGEKGGPNSEANKISYRYISICSLFMLIERNDLHEEVVEIEWVGVKL